MRGLCGRARLPLLLINGTELFVQSYFDKRFRSAESAGPSLVYKTIGHAEMGSRSVSQSVRERVSQSES
jgi:hypothetical protein